MRNYLTILHRLRSIRVGACLLWTVPAYAVDTLQVTTPEPLLEDWRWTTFDEQSGLAGGFRSLAEDWEGNIWIPTDQGLQRYDGLTWETYPCVQ